MLIILKRPHLVKFWAQNLVAIFPETKEKKPQFSYQFGLCLLFAVQTLLLTFHFQDWLLTMMGSKEQDNSDIHQSHNYSSHAHNSMDSKSYNHQNSRCTVFLHNQAKNNHQKWFCLLTFIYPFFVKLVLLRFYEKEKSCVQSIIIFKLTKFRRLNYRKLKFTETDSWSICWT